MIGHGGCTCLDSGMVITRSVTVPINGRETQREMKRRIGTHDRTRELTCDLDALIPPFSS